MAVAEAVAEEARVRSLASHGKTKRVIKWGPLSEMADAAAEVLIDAGVPFYQRGKSLVRPVTVPVQSFHGTTASASQLVEVELPYMRDTLCQNSSWVKYDGRSKKWKDIHPPVEAAQVLLEAVWRLGLPGDRRDHLDADDASGRHHPVQARLRSRDAVAADRSAADAGYPG